MSEEAENLVLTYLRRLDAKFDRMADDMRELKERMGLLETQVAHLAGHTETQYASLSVRIDRINTRLERIERRLDLVEA